MNKRILKLALPSIISNITVPLLGLVDVTITGHMGESRYMAAIAVGSTLPTGCSLSYASARAA